MKYYYTTDEIIKSVKRRIVMPTSQSVFEDQDLLDFGTEEMNMAIVPMVLQQQQDYYLQEAIITLEPNKTRYPIPYRAIGNKIGDVAFLPNGNPGNIMEMTRIDVGQLSDYNQYRAANEVYAFYIANNEICLVPNNQPMNYTGSLLVNYYIRPNTLVPLEEVGVITVVDQDLGVITVSEIPELFTTDDLFDFIMVKSPHKILTFDNAVISIDTNLKTLTFGPGNIPEGLVRGDHVTKATESAIPQLPSDLHVVLAHRIATRCLEALGDTEGLQNANQKLAEMQTAGANLINDRVDHAPRKIVARNGLLRSGLNSRKFRG